MLIDIIQTKPALWNQIPLSERTKAKKKALWKEVENTLGGLYKYLQKRDITQSSKAQATIYFNNTN